MNNVVIYNDKWTSGGVESMIINLLKNFDMTDFKITILVGQKETDVYDDFLKSLNVDFEYLIDGVISNPIKRNLKILKRLGKKIKEINPDIVHINVCNAIGFKYAQIVKKNSKAKTIVHSHNTMIQNDKFGIKKLSHKINKRKEKYADYKIGCSNLAGNFMFDGDFDVLKNGVDYERFKYNSTSRSIIRNELNINDKFVILNIGRFCDQKNQLFLVEFFSKLVNIDDKYRLLLVGEGELKDKIVERVEQLKIQNKVFIVSPKKNIEDYYSAADLFVLPSKHEGLPVVGVEAQANGLPTVFSNTITNEVVLSNHATMLGIDSGDEWSNYIINNTFERYDSKDILASNKYLIEDSSKYLKNIYYKLLK